MAPRSVPHSRRQYVHHLNTPALAAARELPEAEESRFPKFIPPALATLVPRPPRGAQWVHEIKYDGYRFQCHIHRDVRFLTRRGYDWSDRLGHLVTALAPLTSHAVVLDGEVIVETPEGRSDFHALEKELKAKRPSRRLVYYVFDLLYLDAFDLRRVPLIDRKRVLELVLADVAGPVRLSEHLTGDGADVFRRACDLELEGIVSKRMDAAYASGRTDAWTKVTCRHRETLAVVGWAEKDRKFDGIYLARPRDHGLIYAGKLERGFSDDDKAAMLKRLAPLRARTQPMKAARKNFPKAHWVRPQVLVDAEFRGLTGDGLLRHPSFKGVREDLS